MPASLNFNSGIYYEKLNEKKPISKTDKKFPDGLGSFSFLDL